MKHIITIGLLSILFSSCSSNELTRKQAQQLITDFYAYPNVEFAKTSFYAMGAYSKHTRCLIDQGLVRKNSMGNIRINDKGKDYQHPQNERLFVSNERQFKEVTGIKFLDEQKSKATVEYTDERINITAVGSCSGYTDGSINTYTVDLALFDDGWRVDQKVYTNFKASDFPSVSAFQAVANQ